MNRPSPVAQQKNLDVDHTCHGGTPNDTKYPRKKLTLREGLKKWFVHPPSYGRRNNPNSDAKDLSLAQAHPIFQNAALAKIFPTEILLKENETDAGFRLNFFRPRVPLNLITINMFKCMRRVFVVTGCLASRHRT